MTPIGAYARNVAEAFCGLDGGLLARDLNRVVTELECEQAPGVAAH